MAQMKDLNAAARFKQVIRKYAAEVLEELRPSDRWATVSAVDYVNLRATVVYPDEPGNPVSLPIAGMLPIGTGAIVRVTGKTGARYIDMVKNSAPVFGRRNLIDNGDFQVGQRGAYLSGATTGANYLNVDRHALLLNGGAGGTGVWSEGSWGPGTVDISGDAFQFSNKPYLIVGTANASLAAGAYALWDQSIEGANLQHLNWGSSAAKQVTAQGWFYTNVTGTYYLELQHIVSSRFASAPISLTAGQWNYRTVTFPANTVDRIANSVGPALKTRLWLAAGSAYQSGTWDGQWTTTDSKRCPGQINLAATVSNFMVRAGVQWEVGPTATSFEHLSYADSLRTCMRYDEIKPIVVMQSVANQNPSWTWMVPKRAAPTLSLVIQTGTGGGVTNFGFPADRDGIYQSVNNSTGSQAYVIGDSRI